MSQALINRVKSLERTVEGLFVDHPDDDAIERRVALLEVGLAALVARVEYIEEHYARKAGRKARNGRAD